MLFRSKKNEEEERAEGLGRGRKGREVKGRNKREEKGEKIPQDPQASGHLFL